MAHSKRKQVRVGTERPSSLDGRGHERSRGCPEVVKGPAAVGKAEHTGTRQFMGFGN